MMQNKAHIEKNMKRDDHETLLDIFGSNVEEETIMSIIIVDL